MTPAALIGSTWPTVMLAQLVHLQASPSAVCLCSKLRVEHMYLNEGLVLIPTDLCCVITHTPQAPSLGGFTSGRSSSRETMDESVPDTPLSSKLAAARTQHK